LTAELNGTLDLVEGVKLRAGGSYREAKYQTWSTRSRDAEPRAEPSCRHDDRAADHADR
jgi:hypothetical protein